MVTEEERQFMWEMYAPEPRMRLNLGIRRRLAPLLDNDRRRIELLNAILFSMRGAPILYYGDEIGMGDDIWLDDRDGVRTPMQWSAASNAGFSTAHSDQLYAPVIDDATYGYRQVNVAMQQADPDSLLNWTRRMIRIRKAHPVFGRGDLRFLTPENEHVLAYVRRGAGEEILVLVNLSASAQTVTLDLAAAAGKTPLDVLSEKRLAPVTDAPYVLELPPYGYRWLSLQE